MSYILGRELNFEPLLHILDNVINCTLVQICTPFDPYIYYCRTNVWRISSDVWHSNRDRLCPKMSNLGHIKPCTIAGISLVWTCYGLFYSTVCVYHLTFKYKFYKSFSSLSWFLLRIWLGRHSSKPEVTHFPEVYRILFACGKHHRNQSF